MTSAASRPCSLTFTGLAILAVLAFGVGCASSPPPAGADSERPPERERLSTPAASALTTCRENIDDIEARGPDERVEFAVDVCSGIWLQEPCAQAFDRALDLESYQRAGLILRTCRDAYCPEFSPSEADGLALCQATLSDPVSLIEPLDDPDSTEPLEAWAAFNRQIFVRDYAADPDEQLLSGFPSMLLQLVIVAPPRNQ